MAPGFPFALRSLIPILVSTFLLSWTGTAIAQIRPDDSLGEERSRINPGVNVRGDLADLIEGGARRGNNLFHSFEDFSVQDLQRVYFANPDGIANILSRITGSSRSDILGTLGVDGAANLFLINPNGIVFGSNAVLDVDGAFLASTAEHLIFDDGSLFSAVDPDAPPLVTVNIPVGVQFGPNPPASIINEASLEAGGDLTLAAGTVTNIGNLDAGGQVQVQDVVPSEAADISSDPAIAPSADGVQILSSPDDPFEVSWVAPAETGILPDDTLGAESSVLVESVEVGGSLADRVDGGAIRGTNLFHSFTAFNVEEGDRAYFSNPFGVETILSRVTGTGRSDILGTLGVDGAADLFMINPNGMIFGPNAQLDVNGSFLASTGDRFTFGNGLEFRADEPNAAPDIVVSSDIGVQLVEDGTATLTNEADLVLNPAETLTLSGNTVMNSGSITVPGGQVEVLGDRVALIDDAVIDVSGESGGGTALIGGNYQGEGPQHNALRTYVGPNTTINADAMTNGDGGTVIVWADELTGFYGGISARGGSELGNGGFVEVSGKQDLIFRGDADLAAINGVLGTLLLDPVNITIDDVGDNDGLLDADEPNDGDLLGQVLDDEGPIETTISEDKLEGLAGNTNVILEATNNITLNVLDDGELNFQAGTDAGSGRITFEADSDRDGLGNFSMPLSHTIDTNGRPITIRGANLTIGSIDTSSNVNDANGGRISLSANSGNVTIGSSAIAQNIRLDTRAIAGNGDAGDIFIFADGNIEVLESTRDAGNEISTNISGTGTSGYVYLSADNITLRNIDGSVSAFENFNEETNGTTGWVGLYADNNINLIGTGGRPRFFAGTYGNDPDEFDDDDTFGFDPFTGFFINSFNGAVTIDNYQLNTQLSGSNGNAAEISINADNIEIQNNSILLADVNNDSTGEGGGISVNADNLITINNSELSTRLSGSDGIAGDITVQGDTIRLQNNTEVLADISNGSSGTGGDISIAVDTLASINNSRISTAINSRVSENEANDGLGGDISVSGPTIQIQNTSEITARTDDAGDAGNIRIGDTLDATNPITENITIADSTITSLTTSGGDPGNIAIRARAATTDDSIVIDNSVISANIDPPRDDKSSSFSVETATLDILASAGTIELSEGTFVTTRTSGNRDGGDITITVDDLSTNSNINLLDGSRVEATTRREGDAGDVTVSGGNITVSGTQTNAAGLILSGGVFTSAETANSGLAGTISINSPSVPGQSLIVSDGAVISALNRSSLGQTPAGVSIEVNTATVDLSNGGQIITSAEGTDAAGSILINASERVTFSGTSDFEIASNSASGSGVVAEAEANDTRVAPQALLSNDLSLAFDSNIEDSTRIPHLSISGTGDGTFDYYSFDASAGNRVIIDIDNGRTVDETSSPLPGNMDTEVFLFNADGELVAFNDDASNSIGGGGSDGNLNRDSFVDFIVEAGGNYVIGVAQFNSTVENNATEISGTPPGNGTTYTLNVSLDQRNVLNPNQGANSGLFARGNNPEANSGTIVVNTPQLELIDGGQISVATVGGEGHDIRLNVSNSIEINGSATQQSSIEASTQTGTAGDIAINRNTTSVGTITLDNGAIETNAEAAGGTAGNIGINAEIITAANAEIRGSNVDDAPGSNIIFRGVQTLDTTNSFIAASTEDGRAGTITINDGQTAAQRVSFSGAGGAIASAGGDGSANNIVVNADSLTLNNGASIEVNSASTETSDIAGNITIDSNSVTLNNGQIRANTNAGGSAAPAQITFANGLDTLTVNNGQISSSTESGVAGDVSINAATSISLVGNGADSNREGIFVEATNGGNAGNIILTTPQLTATANAEIRASSTDSNPTDSTGQAGFIRIQSADIDLNRALISTSNENGPATAGLGDIRFQGVNTFDAVNSLVTASTNSGFAGSISVNENQTAAQSVSFNGTFGDLNADGIRDGGAIAAALGDGSAGDITINSDQLTIGNRAIIGVSSAGTNVTDTAGDITINATDIAINSNSQIVAQTNAGGTLANPANINLNGLETLTVTNGLISSSTNTGVAGDVIVDASESVTLDGRIAVPQRGGGNVTQPGGMEVQALGDGGLAGNIEVTTPLLTVTNGAQISATTNSQVATPGVNDPDVSPDISAGNITINSADINLSGANTGIISGTTGADNAGSITLQPDNVDETLTVTFAGGAEISASTTGSGDGGDIILNGEAEPDANGFYRGAISLAGEGRVEASAEGGATGNAGGLQINTQQFSLGTGIQILAESITSNGGSVLFQTVDDFVLRNARISVSSRSGRPGGIVIQARNSALISGTLDIDGDGDLDPAGLFATNFSSEEFGEPPSGLLTLSTPTLIIENGAHIETSTDSGVGGTVSINAQSVTLRDQVDDDINTGLFSLSGTGRSGGIRLQEVESLLITGDSQISTATANGVAGGISIVRDEDVPVGSIRLEGTGSAISAAATGAGGTAENLTLSVEDLDVLNGGEISTSNVDSTTGGNIEIQDVETLTVAGGRIAASTDRGTAGGVTIDASVAVNLSGELAPGEAGGVVAEARQGGDAGSVTINAPLLNVTDGAAVTVSSDNGSGVAGNIDINVDTVNVASGGQISAETDAGGASSPANIRLNDVQSLTVNGGTISSATDEGTAGNVIVDADRVFVDNGLISSSATSGTAGSITVEDATLVQLQNTATGDDRQDIVGIQAIATQGGDAGTVGITTDTLTIADGAAVAVSSENGSGTAGNITIAAQFVDLSNDGEISAETDAGGIDSPANINLNGIQRLTISDGLISSATNAGRAGSVTVDANRVVVDNGLISSSSVTGDAGSVAIENARVIQLQNNADAADQRDTVGIQAIATQGGNAGRITLGTEQVAIDRLTITDGAAIAVSSQEGSGTAGDITVNATRVALREGGRISAETDAGGRREPANIRLNGLETLQITDGRISSSTSSGGAGQIRVDASDRIVLRQTTNSGNDVGIVAESTDGGRAGEVRLSADELVVAGGARVAVSASGEGRAGDLSVNASEIQLREQSELLAETEAGRGGNIRLRDVDTLNIINSRISASTASGRAGDIRVIASDSVFIQGEFDAENPAGIQSVSREGGNAGSVFIRTPDLTLQERAEVGVSATRRGDAGTLTINADRVQLNNQAGLSATTERGQGGNIELVRLDTLTLTDESFISASTNRGIAGDISINASESVLLDGGSTLAVEAQGRGGQAGDIEIQAGEVIVRGDTPATPSRITVSSPQGVAGNLEITTGFLNLNAGQITAVTGQRGEAGVEGANIFINIASDRSSPLDFLRLENESLISASAFGEAAGGNVTINSDFIFAFFPTDENGSDIVANAEQGNGGLIDITALGIFGIQFRPEQTPLNDITATSEGGASGVVALNTLEIDPVRGFSALPISFIDLSGLVGQSCAANLTARGDRASSFTLTGQGGVPAAPTDALGIIPDPADWVTVEDESITVSPDVSTRSLPQFALPQIATRSEPTTPQTGLCYRFPSHG